MVSHEMDGVDAKRFRADLEIEGSKVVGHRGDRDEITNVVIPNGIDEIGEGAFTYNCDGAHAFCSALTSITLPHSLVHVGARAFQDCTALTSLTLPPSLVDVGAKAFACCTALTSVTIPNSVKSIGKSAFWGCAALASVTLPPGLTVIDTGAFGDCSGLTSVTLPHSLVDVDNRAFGKCTALSSVVFRPPVSRGAFIAWAVGSCRNRSNWQLTTVERLRNVLRLITTLALWSRDVTSLDPDGSKQVFEGCPFYSNI